MALEKKPRPVPRSSERNATGTWLIALAAGALVIGFVIWGILGMSQGVNDRWMTGTIIAKHFQPQPENQVTIGKGGLSERSIDGEYTLDVRADPGGKIYTVWVEKRDYEAHQTGDTFRFLRPADESR